MKTRMGWISKKFIFGDGNPLDLDHFEYRLDIIAHEYTHAIIESTSNLYYEDQSGALNEHFADVFGIIINHYYNHLSDPYLFVLCGENAKKAKALRSLIDPSQGLRPQPSHMDDLEKKEFQKYNDHCVPRADNDRCGVHALSGIPNKMAAIIISSIGHHNANKLFYTVMTQHLHSSANFSDYKLALIKECKNFASHTCGIVEEALKSVGL